MDGGMADTWADTTCYARPLIGKCCVANIVFVLEELKRGGTATKLN